MKKIISLFKRDYEGTRLVYDEVVEGAEWVVAGEGRATRKLDGTCCMIRDNKLYKRYTVKKGKTPPANFEAATEPDPRTGKQEGWVPVGDGPEDQYYREAFEKYSPIPEIAPTDGTYELIGPKIQGNPENCKDHVLMEHGSIEIEGVPRDYEGLKKWFEGENIEGIVWHHPDGRMVKIKKKDFGLKR